MPDAPMREPSLWINDMPTHVEHHGHYYEADRTFPVAVSFVAANGRAVRANFDPQTGEITTQELEPPADAPSDSEQWAEKHGSGARPSLPGEGTLMDPPPEPEREGTK